MGRMVWNKATFAIGVVAALAVCGQFVAAQNNEDGQTVVQRGFWHNRKQHGKPFPAEGGGKGKANSLEFRPYEKMTRADQDLAADGESTIAERAGFAGLGFNEGKWAYQQIVCPAFPKHLFLQFTRNNGAGEMSMFSASIPRGDGKVRLIPIVKRGYSLFAPAPINKLTITAFNRIRREEAATTTDWFAVGLCYAALAGARRMARRRRLHWFCRPMAGRKFVLRM